MASRSGSSCSDTGYARDHCQGIHRDDCSDAAHAVKALVHRLLQSVTCSGASHKFQASSCKGEAASLKSQVPSNKFQVTSRKFQAASFKLQAASSKREVPSLRLRGTVWVFPVGGALCAATEESCKRQVASSKGGVGGVVLLACGLGLGAGPDLAECRLRGDRVVAARSFRLCRRGSGARSCRPGCRAGLRPGLRAVGRR